MFYSFFLLNHTYHIQSMYCVLSQYNNLVYFMPIRNFVKCSRIKLTVSHGSPAKCLLKFFSLLIIQI